MSGRGEFEDRLAQLLEERARQAVPRDDLAGVEGGVRPIGVDTARPHRARLALAAAAAIVLVVGCVWAIAARGGGDHPADATGIDWVTPDITLRADSVTIDVNGTVFAPVAGSRVKVTSDTLDATYTTFEADWTEHGAPMRWYLSFRSDGTDWWMDEMRTYDGASPQGDWVYFPGERFRTPIGQAFHGDLDLTATTGGYTSHVVVPGLVLQPFRSFDDTGTALPTTTTEPGPSPVFADAPPTPDGLPATGATWTQQQALTVAMASEVLDRECMARAGYEFDPTSEARWVDMFGGWQPADPMGSIGARAASVWGYRFPEVQPSPFDAFYTALTPAEQAAVDLAESGREVDPGVPLTTPSGGEFGSVTHAGGCRGEVDAAFGGLTTIVELYRADVSRLTNGPAQALAIHDDRVVTVLDAWRTCVRAAVSEDAATPDDLARRYAFNESAADEHEKAVAVADATCQATTDLQTIWATALTDRERALMGDELATYDELTRMRVEILATATQVLADRGIVPPSLD
jgi:hypothetical protein